MSRPILYTNAFSNHSNIVTTFLLAANALDKVECRDVDFTKGEHKSNDYLKINPAGQVPALLDGDINVFESSVIMRYLAAKYHISLYPLNDAARLAPIDSAYEHVRQKAWDHGGGLVFQKVFVKRFFGRDGDAERIRTCSENLTKAVDFIGEHFFKHGDWMAAPTLSVADVALGTLLMHAGLAGFQSENPTIQKFLTKWKAQSWYSETSYAKLLG